MIADLTSIDPPGCGCTECLIGEYVPLDEASAAQVAACLRGELSDHSASRWRIAPLADRRVEITSSVWPAGRWTLNAWEIAGAPALDEEGFSRIDCAWMLPPRP